MNMIRPILKSNLFPLGTLGFIGTCYAIVTSCWSSFLDVIALTLLLLIIELFPIRLGKLNFTFCFPILYTMAIVTGYETTALISVMLMALLHRYERRNLKTFTFNASTRMLALLVTGFAIDFINWLHPGPDQSLAFYFVNLLVSVVAFTSISGYFVIRHISKQTDSRPYKKHVFKWGLLNTAVGLLYVGFMLLLASNPRNTESGAIGTLFFYIPLAAITIVLHLLSNLSRAKTSLETLFTVSQSINRQFDLPTVLQQLIREANRLVQGNCGLLYLVQEDGTLKRVVSTTELPDDLLGVTLEPGSGIVGLVAQTGEPMLIPDVSRDARILPLETLCETRTLLVQPIQIDGKVAGVITLSKKETYSFAPDDLKMMNIFATHASVAIKNALYIEEREKRLLLEERNRLAREIHDGIAQDLAGTLLRIEMIKRHAETRQQADLDRLEGLIRNTVSTVRHSIYSLRPQPFSHVGLVPAIRAHLEEAAANSGLLTHLQAESLPERIPPTVAKAVFEIVCEGVRNVVKHAQARNLTVTLQAEEGLLRLHISDDGVGFHFGHTILQAAARRSFGIENLHHIADQVGGSIDFLTAPGQGTVITLEIPLEEDAQHDDSRAAL